MKRWTLAGEFSVYYTGRVPEGMPPDPECDWPYRWAEVKVRFPDARFVPHAEDTLDVGDMLGGLHLNVLRVVGTRRVLGYPADLLPDEPDFRMILRDHDCSRIERFLEILRGLYAQPWQESSGWIEVEFTRPKDEHGEPVDLARICEVLDSVRAPLASAAAARCRSG